MMTPSLFFFTIVELGVPAFLARRLVRRQLVGRLSAAGKEQHRSEGEEAHDRKCGARA